MAVAREVTGESDNATAVKKFREKLNSSESYFNSAPIPKNESDEEAHKKCSDIEGAKKYCPTRWAAMQLWFSESRKVLDNSVVIIEYQISLVLEAFRGFFGSGSFISYCILFFEQRNETKRHKELTVAAWEGRRPNRKF